MLLIGLLLSHMAVLTLPLDNPYGMILLISPPLLMILGFSLVTLIRLSMIMRELDPLSLVVNMMIRVSKT